MENPKQKTPKQDVKYFNEYHRKTTEAGLKYIAKSKKLKIDWDKELERMKINSRD